MALLVKAATLLLAVKAFLTTERLTTCFKYFSCEHLHIALSIARRETTINTHVVHFCLNDSTLKDARDSATTLCQQP